MFGLINAVKVAVSPKYSFERPVKGIASLSVWVNYTHRLVLHLNCTKKPSEVKHLFGLTNKNKRSYYD